MLQDSLSWTCSPLSTQQRVGTKSYCLRMENSADAVQSGVLRHECDIVDELVGDGSNDMGSKLRILTLLGC